MYLILFNFLFQFTEFIVGLCAKNTFLNRIKIKTIFITSVIWMELSSCQIRSTHTPTTTIVLKTSYLVDYQKTLRLVLIQIWRSKFLEIMIHFQLWTFFCFESNEGETLKFELYPIGILISCAFFSATLVVYLSIPKLRNLPGKILICLVLSLLVAYLGIAWGQISPPSDNYCSSFGML